MLGAGEGTVFTAGSAWIVDLAPPERRGRVIGLYGLAVWAGLSVGPLIGELLLHASGYTRGLDLRRRDAAARRAIATRVPDPYRPRPSLEHEHHPLIAREAVRPGAALALGSIGYATVAAFVVLHLDARGVGHGAPVFGAFATMVVLTRLVGGDLPDRVGPARVAIAAALVEAVGLTTIALAHSLPVAIAGALAMGAAFSLLYPSLSLIVVDRVPETPARRGARHLHRLLRRRRRPRGAAGRHRRGADQLRGRLPARRRDRRSARRRMIALGDRRPLAAPSLPLADEQRLQTARPIRPRRSESTDSAVPMPLGRGRVTASTQTHSPSGIRSRWTVRSTLMKRNSAVVEDGADPVADVGDRPASLQRRGLLAARPAAGASASRRSPGPARGSRPRANRHSIAVW